MLHFMCLFRNPLHYFGTLENKFIVMWDCINIVVIVVVVFVVSNNDASILYTLLHAVICLYTDQQLVVVLVLGPGSGPGPATSTCPHRQTHTPCQVDALVAAAAPVMTGWKPPPGWVSGWRPGSTPQPDSSGGMKTKRVASWLEGFELNRRDECPESWSG